MPISIFPSTKINLLTLLFFALITTSSAHAQLGKLKDKVQKTIETSIPKGKTGLSEEDIAAGLREALQRGSENAADFVSVENGFFGNNLIKVIMPPEAKKVETKLREIKQDKLVDDLILSMNRAAENASPHAKRIFSNAIATMSIADGLSILKGTKNAATEYLKSKTTAELNAAFEPKIKESLEKVNATKYWATVFNTYNKFQLPKNQINPDLPAYVTERALNGIFVHLANEELKIRENPAARVSELLKRVFGGE